MKKRKISSEFVYLSGAVILAFATALLTASDLGLSMVIAPAHRIEGIGLGTVVLACCNGLLIGWYGKCFDQYFETYPVLEKFAEKFEL